MYIRHKDLIDYFRHAVSKEVRFESFFHWVGSVLQVFKSPSNSGSRELGSQFLHLVDELEKLMS